MAMDQIDLQIEVPVKIPKEEERQTQQSPPALPLTLLLHQAKIRMIQTTNSIMQDFGLPAALMEGILSEVLAEIRAQTSADLLTDFKKHMSALERHNQQKEGEKLE